MEKPYLQLILFFVELTLPSFFFTPIFFVKPQELSTTKEIFELSLSQIYEESMRGEKIFEELLSLKKKSV